MTVFTDVVRRLANGGLAAAIALAPQTPAVAGAPSTANSISIESCQSTDEATFRKVIETVTAQALTKGLATVDYRAAVGDQWRQLSLGSVIDKQVDAAIAEVRDETSWGALIQSLGNQDKARELTTTVAERVYRSEALKTSIEALAGGVGKSLAVPIEDATTGAAGPALECLKAYLGPRYGLTIASAVSGQAGGEFQLDPSKAAGDVTPDSVLRQSGQGIAGAAILVVRRQLANMAGRIGQRVAGSILSRLVSVVAGGIGLVLIAKDVWELRNGALPIIAGEMKSDATKSKVQDELATAISEQIGLHVQEIGVAAADRVMAVWQDFRSAHAKTLELSERNAAFKSFLDQTRPQAIGRVSEVTALVLAADGEAGISKRLADGSLHQAVNVMPDAAMEIARQTRSLETALAWNGVAGDLIDDVVKFEVFRRTEPSAVSKVSLSQLFELDDPLAITRMASTSRPARDALFELDLTTLGKVARVLEAPQLETLASYMTGLGKEPRDRLLAAVGEAPSELQILARPRVRDAVLASKDQTEAIEMVMRSGDGLTFKAALEDLQRAADGRIAPILIWEKHPLTAMVLAAGLILILLLFRRLFRPRGRTVAVQ